jgi:hypothetical protein
MTLELRFHSTVREVGEAHWNRLAPPLENPFVSFAWLDALEQTGCVGGDTGWHPHHLAAYQDGTPVMVAPLYVKAHSEGEFVFDWAWADAASQLGEAYYPKVIAAVPFTPATGPRALGAHPERDAILATGLSALLEQTELHSAHVLFPPQASVARFEEAGFLLRYGVQFQFENRGYRDFEGFLTSLPSKRRTQLRRERKQIALDGLTMRALRSDELTSELIDHMYAFYTSTVDKFRWGRRYLNRAFFETLCAGPLREQMAWVMAFDGARPVAGAFNVRSATHLYGRYWGASLDRPFLHFNVCYYAGIDLCLELGLTRFEPGAGGEHKRARGFLPTRTLSVHAVKSPNLRRALVPFLARERRAIDAFIADPDDAG